MHAVAPTGAYEPAGHTEHAVDPLVPENEPAGQAEQAVEPAETAYSPAAQETHEALALLPSIVLDVPALHSEHEPDPGVGLYVPATHVPQSCPVVQ